MTYKPLPRPCDKCQKRFQPRGKFTKKCDNCKKKSNQQKFKEFKNKSLIHGNIINTENKYKCEACGKKFRLKMSLMNHRCYGF